ncbi:MAG: hypothetical protein R2749_30965 [Acidimicrobiales bacterium]
MDALCNRAMAKLMLFMDDAFGVGWHTIELEVHDAFAVLANYKPT